MTAKKIIKYLCVFVVAPLIVLCGVFFFGDRKYAFISLALSVVACIPFFISFEKGENNTTRLVIIAVMVALSVIGRLVFYYVPGFKPVTAMVIITAIYFGAEAGFMTGALTALISNFFFGQGMWTPFQMLAWGLIGFAAGLLTRKLINSKLLLCTYGAVSGIAYSLLLDLFGVIWADTYFNFSRYIAMVVSSAPFTILYAASNVIFLLVLQKPLGKKLERVKDKYGI